VWAALCAEAKKLVGKGNVLMGESEWAETIDSFQMAVAMDPNDDDAWCGLGLAEHKNAGKHVAASFEPYMRCLKLKPTDPVAHTNLASVLQYVRRDVDNAERMLRRALEIDPDYPNAHWKLSGLLLQERGDLDGSIKQMEEYNRCGGIPGYDGKAQLAKLVAKKKKMHAKVRDYSMAIAP
jgi:Flp pilus assembly protein TadD